LVCAHVRFALPLWHGIKLVGKNVEQNKVEIVATKMLVRSFAEDFDVLEGLVLAVSDCRILDYADFSVGCSHVVVKNIQLLLRVHSINAEHHSSGRVLVNELNHIQPSNLRRLLQHASLLSGEVARHSEHSVNYRTTRLPFREKLSVADDLGHDVLGEVSRLTGRVIVIITFLDREGLVREQTSFIRHKVVHHKLFF
jgi:hypothetical protein